MERAALSPRTTPSRGVRPVLIACLLVVASVAACAAAEPSGARQSKLCLDCHTGKDSTLVGTPHQLTAGEGGAVPVDCTDCHGTDTAHWEDDPAAHPMTQPSTLRADAEARLCAGCHQSAHQQDMRERNLHLTNDVSCSSCHSVHRPAHPPLLRKAEPALCIDCHPRMAGEFARPTHHPVNEGVVACSDCHVTHGATTARRLERTPSEVCTRCHAQMQGPFPFEHPATMGFSTEEGGCASCHEPHGSALPRLLKQPYEGPRFPLCAQCHAVPGHLSNPMHGTRWAGVPCADCHTDIHGSYVSRLFLSESLRTQGCFNVGCHAF
jgi:DmsE family decaheme c-type cytochrome